MFFSRTTLTSPTVACIDSPWLVSAKRRQLALDALTIVLVYLLLCPLWAMPVYERLLFFPDKNFNQQFDQFEFQQIFEKYGAHKKDVQFRSADGALLSGWYFYRPGTMKVILVSHGNAGNISNRLILADALINCRASVFLYDYQGYGLSQGSPSLANICADGLAAFDYLMSIERFKPRDIIVYGESIGTGVACNTSRERQAGGIVLQSGFPSLLYAAHDRLWFTWLYPDQWFRDLDNLGAMKKQHAPLLVIHGKDDAVFPARYAGVIADKASTPRQLLLIDNMGHTLDDPTNGQFLQAVTKFVDELPADALQQSARPGRNKL
ncbi:MAG: alpha/beta hydrolase [Cyanobacteria bacterium SZAS LIN-3]|nr:alpha/beta hydrolase [Cyanobacteria bacterium SZAS LIN-3]MBS2010344.1 alpha/beta hydrolase [Cyanobacteria bacterium SZAS TMP-1]